MDKHEQDDIDRVNASYQRCLLIPDFIADFYQNFTAKGPHIVEKFKGTDMKRQIDTLKHGLQYIIMYSSGSKIAMTKVEDLGVTHDRNHRNITPDLYEAWVTSLIETVRKHDPQYSDELAMSWRNVLSYGIQRMQNMY
ncbi:globin [Bdellovibrio sp. HCB209]|uniref:globin n=1 Tax=Bdellovibrio sp. HCB209 TaxID=3394354 RepID=UPI0039B46F49